MTYITSGITMNTKYFWGIYALKCYVVFSGNLPEFVRGYKKVYAELLSISVKITKISHSFEEAVFLVYILFFVMKKLPVL